MRDMLGRSSKWADFGHVAVAESWFEDNPEVAQRLGSDRSGRAWGHKATDYVLQTVLERRREKWAEHFLWMAL